MLLDIAAHSNSSLARKGTWRLGFSQGPHPVRLGPFRPYLPTLVTAKRLAMAENAALQRLDAVACELQHGSRAAHRPRPSRRRSPARLRK